MKKAYGLSVQKACHSFSQCMGNSFRQTVAGIFSDRRMKGGCDAPIAIIATAARTQASKGDYLIASQDTTFYNYTGHKKMDGLGKLQSGILGILQHSVLLASEKGVPLGLIDNQLDIKRAVAFYGLRWRVDHLHFTMESGVGPRVRLNVDK